MRGEEKWERKGWIVEGRGEVEGRRRWAVGLGAWGRREDRDGGENVGEKGKEWYEQEEQVKRKRVGERGGGGEEEGRKRYRSGEMSGLRVTIR